MPQQQRHISSWDALQLRIIAGLYAYNQTDGLSGAKEKIETRCDNPAAVWEMFPDQVEEFDRANAMQFLEKNGKGILSCNA